MATKKPTKAPAAAQQDRAAELALAEAAAEAPSGHGNPLADWSEQIAQVETQYLAKLSLALADVQQHVGGPVDGLIKDWQDKYGLRMTGREGDSVYKVQMMGIEATSPIAPLVALQNWCNKVRRTINRTKPAAG